MARKLVQYYNRAKDLLAYLDSTGKWFARWFETSGQYKSTIAGTSSNDGSDPFEQQGTGEPPIIVDSDILVENLNSDKLGNYYGNFYFGLNGSTGVTSFAGITNVGDGSHFNVGAVSGYIIDNLSDPDNPTVIKVDYPGESNLTTPYKLTDYLTYLLIDSTGTLVMQPAFPTCAERRQKIYIGNVVHPLDSVVAVQDTPDFIQSSQSQLRDLWRAFRLINEGISYSAYDANLKISRSAGRIYGNGISFKNTPLSPNRIDFNSQTPVTFSYRTQTGSGVDNVTDIDPNQWDDAGTLKPVDNNKFTVQRIFITPSGLTRIQYGQQVYPDLATATQHVNDPFVTFVPLSRDAIVVQALVIKQGTTDISDATKASFISASKFGELTGGGGSSSPVVTADNVTITDAGGYYDETSVEGALQEIGAAPLARYNESSIEYYVAKTGSDSNPGTALSPFLTINHAISLIPKYIRDYVDIYVDAGIYDEVVNLTGFHGNAWLSITGDSGTPSNVKISNLQIWDCTVPYVLITGITVTPGVGEQGIVIEGVTSTVQLEACEADTASADVFIYAEDASSVKVKTCFAENVAYAIRAQDNSNVFSEYWVENSTALFSALSAERGSTIAIGGGDQPLGTGGGMDYSTSDGGIVHREANMIPQNYVSATEPIGYNFNVGDVWFIP